MTHTESVNVQLIEFEGPSDPDAPPPPDSSILRWQMLRELYREAAAARPRPTAFDSDQNESAGT
jgi:hypothetical protein